jgi:hypothetical protein
MEAYCHARHETLAQRHSILAAEDIGDGICPPVCVNLIIKLLL